MIKPLCSCGRSTFRTYPRENASTWFLFRAGFWWYFVVLCWSASAPVITQWPILTVLTLNPFAPRTSSSMTLPLTISISNWPVSTRTTECNSYPSQVHGFLQYQPSPRGNWQHQPLWQLLHLWKRQFITDSWRVSRQQFSTPTSVRWGHEIIWIR